MFLTEQHACIIVIALCGWPLSTVTVIVHASGHDVALSHARLYLFGIIVMKASKLLPGRSHVFEYPSLLADRSTVFAAHCCCCGYGGSLKLAGLAVKASAAPAP